MTLKQFAKQAWPWFVGLVIVFVLAVRLPLEAFSTAMHTGPHLQLALVDTLVIIATLLSDTFVRERDAFVEPSRASPS